MKEFEELVNIIDTLLGPNGCPWDQEQTLQSLRPSVLEEACEVIEAIDLDDNHHIQEELGDLFFNALFFCKVAEKEQRLKTPEVLADLNAKLIRRHPHVFGDTKLSNTEQVMNQWDTIKKTEKGKTHRVSSLDSLPKGLPALSRAYKIIEKISKTNYLIKQDLTPEFENEADLGQLLWSITAKACNKGLDPEHALRKVLAKVEKDFREIEIAEKGKNPL